MNVQYRFDVLNYADPGSFFVSLYYALSAKFVGLQSLTITPAVARVAFSVPLWRLVGRTIMAPGMVATVQ